MNIKKLTLKNLLDDDWTFEPDFYYANVSGSAELYKNSDSMILFRKKDSKEVSVVRFHAILNYDKKLFYTVNKLMTNMELNIKMGIHISKIIKMFGTPTFTYYKEEDYNRYYWRYPSDFYDYNDIFYVAHYHYLISPDLLICFGIPKNSNQLTDLEIVNDKKIISEIMETRKAIKEYDKTIYQPQQCFRLLKQEIKNKDIIKLQSKNIRFIKTEIKNCTVEEIKTEDFRLRDCLFYNVTFKNHFETGLIQVEQCKFINCIFHDTFENNFIQLKNNFFENCLFKKISMEKEDGICNVNRNKFFNCTFKDISWKGEGVFFWSEIKNSKIKQVFYRTNDISRSEFSDIYMEQVELKIDDEDSIGLLDNKFNTVTFRNVIIKGSVENTYFVNCDTNGLKILI